MSARLLKVPEAREILGISNPTIYRWMRTGKLQSVKIGGLRRIPEDAIEQFIEAGRQGGGE